MTASARHETPALLRAHLSAAVSYRHLTRHCPICHRLLRLAMEPGQQGEEGTHDSYAPHDPLTAEEGTQRPDEDVITFLCLSRHPSHPSSASTAASPRRRGPQ